MPSKIWKWTAADGANINKNNISLLKENLNELKWIVFLKEKNEDFHLKRNKLKGT